MTAIALGKIYTVREIAQLPMTSIPPTNSECLSSSSI